MHAIGYSDMVIVISWLPLATVVLLQGSIVASLQLAVFTNCLGVMVTHSLLLILVSMVPDLTLVVGVSNLTLVSMVSALL